MKQFQTLETLEKEVPARPAGLWTPVCEFVEGPGLLSIAADPKGQWSYAEGNVPDCGPDGDPLAFLARSDCLAADAPVGALIGKIGGSTAGIKDGTIFAVGSACIVRVPDDGGPLFLTINDTVDGMANNGGSIRIEAIARADASPAQPVAHPPPGEQPAAAAKPASKR